MVDKNNDLSRPLRVALLYTSERRLSDLAKVLESNGLTIAGRYRISAPALETVTTIKADVILVDLDESAEQVLDVLEHLLESATLPILFNDNATTDFVVNTVNPEWGRRLAGKLWTLAKRKPPPQRAPTPPKPAARAPVVPARTPSPAPSPRARAAPARTTAAGKNTDGLKDVWVLGASLGGPLAVRQFLLNITEELPVTFVLAQHIGASHLDLLAEQLGRVASMKVSVAVAGQQLKPNEVILAPVDDRIIVDERGNVVLRPKGETIYSPCIDFVMEDMAARFRERCGTIVFSGMGNDGERGCHAVAEYGGPVWAQDAESCVISSMPDSARRTGHVTLSGSPEQLAQALIKRYRGNGR